MEITIKVKSKDEEISKLMINRDLGYKSSICPQFSRSHLYVTWGILTGFSGCRGQRTLVLGCVRDDSLRDACKSGESISDIGREPTRGDLP